MTEGEQAWTFSMVVQVWSTEAEAQAVREHLMNWIMDHEHTWPYLAERVEAEVTPVVARP